MPSIFDHGNPLGEPGLGDEDNDGTPQASPQRQPSLKQLLAKRRQGARGPGDQPSTPQFGTPNKMQPEVPSAVKFSLDPDTNRRTVMNARVTAIEEGSSGTLPTDLVNTMADSNHPKQDLAFAAKYFAREYDLPPETWGLDPYKGNTKLNLYKDPVTGAAITFHTAKRLFMPEGKAEVDIWKNILKGMHYSDDAIAAMNPPDPTGDKGELRMTPEGTFNPLPPTSNMTNTKFGTVVNPLKMVAVDRIFQEAFKGDDVDYQEMLNFTVMAAPMLAPDQMADFKQNLTLAASMADAYSMFPDVKGMSPRAAQAQVALMATLERAPTLDINGDVELKGAFQDQGAMAQWLVMRMAENPDDPAFRERMQNLSESIQNARNLRSDLLTMLMDNGIDVRNKEYVDQYRASQTSRGEQVTADPSAPKGSPANPFTQDEAAEVFRSDPTLATPSGLDADLDMAFEFVNGPIDKSGVYWSRIQDLTQQYEWDKNNWEHSLGGKILTDVGGAIMAATKTGESGIWFTWDGLRWAGNKVRNTMEGDFSGDTYQKDADQWFEGAQEALDINPIKGPDFSKGSSYHSIAIRDLSETKAPFEVMVDNGVDPWKAAVVDTFMAAIADPTNALGGGGGLALHAAGEAEEAVRGAKLLSWMIRGGNQVSNASSGIGLVRRAMFVAHHTGWFEGGVMGVRKGQDFFPTLQRAADALIATGRADSKFLGEAITFVNDGFRLIGGRGGVNASRLVRTYGKASGSYRYAKMLDSATSLDHSYVTLDNLSIPAFLLKKLKGSGNFLDFKRIMEGSFRSFHGQKHGLDSPVLNMLWKGFRENDVLANLPEKEQLETIQEMIRVAWGGKPNNTNTNVHTLLEILQKDRDDLVRDVEAYMKGGQPSAPVPEWAKDPDTFKAGLADMDSEISNMDEIDHILGDMVGTMNPNMPGTRTVGRLFPTLYSRDRKGLTAVLDKLANAVPGNVFSLEKNFSTKIEQYMKRGGLKGDRAGELMRRAVELENLPYNAPGRTEKQLALLDDVMQDMITKIAKDHGIDVTLFPEVVEKIMSKVGRGHNDLNKALFGVYRDATGHIVHVKDPMLTTQLANRWAMVDPITIRDAVLDATGVAKDMWNKARVLAGKGMLPTTLEDAQRASIAIWGKHLAETMANDWYLRWWKPMQVLSFRYLFRVPMFDEQLRFLSDLGGYQWLMSRRVAHYMRKGMAAPRSFITLTPSQTQEVQEVIRKAGFADDAAAYNAVALADKGMLPPTSPDALKLDYVPEWTRKVLRDSYENDLAMAKELSGDNALELTDEWMASVASTDAKGNKLVYHAEEPTARSKGPFWTRRKSTRVYADDYATFADAGEDAWHLGWIDPKTNKLRHRVVIGINNGPQNNQLKRVARVFGIKPIFTMDEIAQYTLKHELMHAVYFDLANKNPKVFARFIEDMNNAWERTPKKLKKLMENMGGDVTYTSPFNKLGAERGQNEMIADLWMMYKMQPQALKETAPEFYKVMQNWNMRMEARYRSVRSSIDVKAVLKYKPRDVIIDPLNGNIKAGYRPPDVYGAYIEHAYASDLPDELMVNSGRRDEELFEGMKAAGGAGIDDRSAKSRNPLKRTKQVQWDVLRATDGGAKGERMHMEAWFNHLTRQFRNDDAGARTLDMFGRLKINSAAGRERAIKDLVDWMETDDIGKTWAKVHHIAGRSRSGARTQRATALVDELGHLLGPGDADDKALFARAVLSGDQNSVRRLLENVPVQNRPAIHGFNLNQLAGDPAAEVTNFIYKFILELPTNKLSRQPYFRAWYNSTREAMIANLESMNVGVTEKQLKLIDAHARQFAIDRTQQIMFDFRNQSRISEMMGFVAPFMQPFMEAFMVWGHLIRQNPALIYYARQVDNFAENSGFIRKDPLTGEKTIPLTYFMAAAPVLQMVTGGGFADGASLTAPLSSFNFVFASMFPMPKNPLIGDIGIPLPSFSPPIMWLMQGLAKSDHVPKFLKYSMTSWAFQYGEIDWQTPEATILPTWMRHAMSGAGIFKDDQDEAKINSTTIDFVRMMQAQGITPQKYAEEHGIPVAEAERAIWNQAKGMAEKTYYWRSWASLFMPAAPSIHWPTEQAEIEYRQMTAEYGWDAGRDMFIQKHPDLSYIAIASTYNSKLDEAGNPIEVSLPANQLVQKILDDPEISKIAEENPVLFSRWAWLLIPSEVWKEPFDRGMFFQQMSEGSRSTKDMERWWSDVDAAQGWDAYMGIRATWANVQAQMTDQGLTSDSVTWQTQATKFNEAKDSIKRLYPGFAVKLDTIELNQGADPIILNEIHKILQIPMFRQTQVGQGLADYMSFRDEMEGRMKELGITSLDSVSAEQYGLDEQYNSTVEKMFVKYGPDFERAYDLFLSNDLMGVATKGDEQLEALAEDQTHYKAVQDWEVQYESLQQDVDAAGTQAQKTAAYLELKKWTNYGETTLVMDVDGEMVTPQSIWWNQKSPAEKRVYTENLSTLPYQFLSRFDRERVLGEATSDSAEEKWLWVADMTKQIQDYRDKNPGASVTSMYDQVDDYVDTWTHEDPVFSRQVTAANQWGYMFFATHKDLLHQGDDNKSDSSEEAWSALATTVGNFQDKADSLELTGLSDANPANKAIYREYRKMVYDYITNDLFEYSPLFKRQWKQMEDRNGSDLLLDSLFPTDYFRLGT